MVMAATVVVAVVAMLNTWRPPEREPDPFLLSYEHDEENGGGSGKQRVGRIGGEIGGRERERQRG